MRPSARRVIILLYALSGFCLLSFETIWIRTLSNQMGGTSFSSAVIISTFFVFAALGNLCAGRIVRRCANPLRFYGICELSCAALAVLSFSLRFQTDFLLNAGVEAFVLRHFAYAAMILAAPSFINGATFPFLAQALMTRDRKRVESMGPVYAGNLIGSALGVLIGGVWLPCSLGYAAAFYLLAGILVVVGICVIAISHRNLEAPLGTCRPGGTPGLRRAEIIGRIVLVSSGVLSILLEILSIAYVRQFTSHSLYSVAAVLFAFIVNFGVASWIAARWRRSSEHLLAVSLAVAGLACVAFPFFIQLALNCALPIVAPYSVLSTAELAMTVTLFLAPLQIPAGMVYPLAWNLVKRDSEQHGHALGHIAAWNKFGSAFGAFAGPFLLFPLCGISGASIGAGIIYLSLALTLALLLLERSGIRRALLSLCSIGLVAAAAAFTVRHAPIEIPDKSKLIAAYDGADGIVAVTEDEHASRHIVVNNSYVLNGTERALLSQKHESWLPLALSRHPQRVAFIGMASGISANAALDFPIEKLDAIEIVPEVARAAREQFGKWNARLFADPRASICINDGRFVILSTHAPYDLIICDLLLPAQEGTSSIYSKNFLVGARSKLAENGMFCLWLPLYQLDAGLCGMAIRTFLESFPNVVAIRGNLDPLQPTMALLGSAQPIDLSSEFLSKKLQAPEIQTLSSDSPFFRSVSNLRLTLLGDIGAARADFSAFEINTDDHPIFAFEGPRPVPMTQSLCGFAFLKWFGRRFLQPEYPSCFLGNTPSDELLAGIRAGNHLYAASVSAVDLPTTADEQMQRARQVVEHIETACRLSPENDFKQIELGH
jgi:spermidine synthase